jgi:hypothetical protein
MIIKRLATIDAAARKLEPLAGSPRKLAALDAAPRKLDELK